MICMMFTVPVNFFFQHILNIDTLRSTVMVFELNPYDFSTIKIYHLYNCKYQSIVSTSAICGADPLKFSTVPDMLCVCRLFRRTTNTSLKSQVMAKK